MSRGHRLQEGWGPRAFWSCWLLDATLSTYMWAFFIAYFKVNEEKKELEKVHVAVVEAQRGVEDCNKCVIHFVSSLLLHFISSLLFYEWDDLFLEELSTSQLKSGSVSLKALIINEWIMNHEKWLIDNKETMFRRGEVVERWPRSSTWSVYYTITLNRWGHNTIHISVSLEREVGLLVHFPLMDSVDDINSG